MAPLRKAWSLRWSWIGSILVGAAIAPAALESVNYVVGRYLKQYDIDNPIVSMSGRLVDANPDEVLVNIAGTKSADRADECSFVRVQAYTKDAAGVLRDAYIKRVDMQEDGHTKPAGAFDIGVWRIWPRGDAVAVLVFALHDCGGRNVRTNIAEVAL
jgi:hypothetical protein